MSESKSYRQSLIAKRARALAVMLLTRREHLLIEEVSDDIGLDFIARFHTKGKAGLREFGLKLQGAWAAATKDHAGKALRPSIQQMQRNGPLLRPVCLFFFTMENDGAWYIWVAEPLDSEDGKALLCHRREPDCRRLDEGALKAIVQRVDWWYDAGSPSLTVNGPGGAKADRKRAKQ
jgi:hypothetical protein